LTRDHLQHASELARYRRSLTNNWSQVRVENVEATGADPMHVGSQLEVKAKVNLGPLSPEDVQVQLFHGVVDNLGEIPQPATATMSHNGAHDGNSWLFKGKIACRSSGQHGFAVRVLPKNADLPNPFEPGLVCWG
jgi:glycogen phosphorylase